MKTIKVIFAAVVLLVAASSNAQTPTVLPDSLPAKFKVSLNQMLGKYLEIEDALLKGNTAEAGKAADSLDNMTVNIDVSGLSAQQLKIFKKQAGKVKHNAEHIRDNAKDYDHQCEHFDVLTDAFYSLLKNFRFNTTTLYYNYTAEGNAGNSAHWITEKETLENPYFKGAKRQVGDKRVEVLQGR